MTTKIVIFLAMMAVLGVSYKSYKALNDPLIIKNDIPIVLSSTTPVEFAQVDVSTSTLPIEIKKEASQVAKKYIISTPSTTTKVAQIEPTVVTAIPVSPTPKLYTEDQIVQEWSSRVVIVQCYTSLHSYHGSGLAYTTKSGELMVLTAKHIMFSDDKKVTTEYCSVIFPDDLKTLYRVEPGDRYTDPKFDIAYLKLKKVSPSVQTLLAGKSLNVCTTANISIGPTTGEPVVIIGYPDYIQSHHPSTVMEYRTDEFGDNYGNYAIVPGAGGGYSGGVVISMKSNCNLGMEDSGSTAKAYVIDLNRSQTIY